MATTDTTSDTAHVAKSTDHRSNAVMPTERWPVLRWAALLALGALALPCYAAILQVSGTFLNQPGTLFWPQLGVTALYIAACWLVLRSFPVAGRRARWVELGLI